MAQLKAVTPWVQATGAGEIRLPEATEQGDQLILVAVWSGGVGRPYSIPSSSGWKLVKAWRGWTSGFSDSDGVDVYQAMRAEGVPNWLTWSRSLRAAFRMFLFDETQGIGATRDRTGAVPVKPYGGAFIVARTPSVPGFISPADPRGLGATFGFLSTNTGGTLGFDEGRFAIELLPPRGPNAPELLAPGAGAEVSNVGTLEFAWRHRPVLPGGQQDAYELRAVGPDEVERYWNASTQTWTTTQTTNPSSVQGTGIPVDSFPSDEVSSWSVRTREGVDGRWSPWATPLSFMPVDPPTVTVTGPPASVVEDVRPVVSWTADAPRGRQTAWQVCVLDGDGRVLHTSGVFPDQDEEYQVPVLDWTNGATYTAQVRVQQTGGSWSLWAGREFTLSWTPPQTPEVAAWASRQGVVLQVETQPGLKIGRGSCRERE